jgi:hypothetical protein
MREKKELHWEDINTCPHFLHFLVSLTIYEEKAGIVEP